jgi:hypothetical protein
MRLDVEEGLAQGRRGGHFPGQKSHSIHLKDWLPKAWNRTFQDMNADI